jgi:hypothetical protein
MYVHPSLPEGPGCDGLSPSPSKNFAVRMIDLSLDLGIVQQTINILFCGFQLVQIVLPRGQ